MTENNLNIQYETEKSYEGQYKPEKVKCPKKSTGLITDENKLMDDLCKSSSLSIIKN